MKDIRCMFGFHDWTQWRKPADKRKDATLGSRVVGDQVRRCKRCPKTEHRAHPLGLGHVPPRPLPPRPPDGISASGGGGSGGNDGRFTGIAGTSGAGTSGSGGNSK